MKTHQSWFKRDLFILLMIGLATSLPLDPVVAQTGLDFDGSNDYVTFGVASDLGVQTFTIETWFRRDGAGITTSTGTGGITNGIPLVTKGRGEADGNNKDMNFFLGIRSSDNVIAADFEDMASGGNHPIYGVTPITTGIWYHVAVTYNGSKWQLFLNGILEAELTVNQTPRYDSIQHAGLATAMTSAGAAAGYFDGVLDEVRIWNRARTQQAIQDSMNLEITSGNGLKGRWGLNEGSGTTANNSVSGGSNGTLTNGPLWVTGSPFSLHNALDYGTGTAYVTFGNPSALGLAQFTIETWFKREGTGTTANTGTGGVQAIPLVTKGRGEAEGSNVDMNYFLGIRSSDNVLCADFEEGSGGSSPGLNHPVIGITAITNNTWYHAAATYDGTTWKLYLNGILEAQLAVGQPPQSSSIQHAGLATALNSTGVIEGHFDGVLDEARIWNYARTQAEILATINAEITSSQTGLVGRWGLDEGAGTTVYGSAGTTVNGTITNTGYSWVAGAPFNITALPPAAPSDLVATAVSYHQINLSWTDNADNESNFEIERSSTSSGGPFSLIATVGANTTTYTNTNLLPETQYWYRVRATNGAGNSDYSNVDDATTSAETSYALDFGTGTAYATFGSTATLGLAQFTIETWFKREGTGSAASTGTGGFSAIPLVTKGRGEAETPTNLNMNYFLGIRSSDNVLCADFEEGAGGASPGLNHPVIGVTPISNDTWYHAAVTYDGTTWKLYLNGALETELAVGQPPESNSIQHAGLGTAMNSTGVTEGHFDGVLDEARIWNFARTSSEILATINSQLSTPQTGLIARWGLNEGSGAMVYGGAGTTVNGNIMNSGYSWVGGAPFNIATNPPDAPTNLTATATVGTQIILAWTDNSNNESNFQIERSTTGETGPFSLRATVGANVTTYTDAGLNAGMPYWYRVRATNAHGNSDYTNVATAMTPTNPNNALDFGGTNAYVTFGTAPSLNTATFTIECWLNRQGAGVATETGTGGIPSAIPLVAKGAAEAEQSDIDINYFLGIDASTGVLVADFEEGAGGSAPSQNHPIYGSTTLSSNTWYHAAVTYDGTTWKLYLNGTLDATLTVGQPAASGATNSLAALATSLQSNGTAKGFFDGVLDEVHIWNYARTESEIQATINSQIETPQTGLIGCWNINEGSGTAVNGSAGVTVNGTVTGSNWSWAAGAPFNITINHAPDAPVLVSPSNGATNISTAPDLTVTVSDPDADNLTVTFYGRVKSTVAQQDFTLVDLPDTQYYSQSYPDIFNSQTQWIVDNRAALNIPYVAHVGDIVESGDSSESEWQNANTAMSILESVLPPDGIPYGIAVGNHDQQPNGNPDGTTKFNEYFGVSRFSGRGYYGGHYGSDNDNHYDLFNASDMDFIVIYIEYDSSPDQAILDWADNLLKTYSTRRGIVVSHNIINTGNPGSWSTQGQAIYDNLKDNSNLFLMLCGHVVGEGRRADTYNSNTVYTLLADYQGRTNGGDGWLRYMTFKPSENKIYVYTYRPARTGVSEAWETDGDSQFTLDYAMQPSFQVIGTNTNVPSGSNTSVTWNGLSYDTEYEWYVTVNDGNKTTTGATWSFTTESAPPPGVLVEAKVFLEGPYDVDTNMMTTSINGLIPTTSPYSEDARTVSSIPANVTDWVLVQLRSTANGSAVASKSAFLHKDGRIVADDGTTGQITLNASAGNYYLVIKHRNHLKVMSTNAVTLNSSSSTLYDFTTGSAKYYGTGGSKELESGVWGMIAGDGNGDGGVYAEDYTLYKSNQGYEGYHAADYNMDGGVYSEDYTLRKINQGKETTVPN